MTDIEVRRLGPGDEAVLDKVAEDVFDKPIRPDRAAAYLREANHLLVVAIADGVVVGQCAAVTHRHPDKVTELYLDEVGVAPTHYRQGIATRMIREMLSWGRERGCEEAWVGTKPDNIAARALYRRLDPKEEETFVMYVIDLPGG